jgi:hypothetical protein
MRRPVLIRLEKLEAGLLAAGCRQNNRYAAHRQFIEREAIRQMSEYEQGRELTSRGLAALQAYGAALEKECQKLGYKSLATLDKHCGVA